jgi:hypothetical protein
VGAASAWVKKLNWPPSNSDYTREKMFGRGLGNFRTMMQFRIVAVIVDSRVAAGLLGGRTNREYRSSSLRLENYCALAAGIQLQSLPVAVHRV